jgi:hypothetical protein
MKHTLTQIVKNTKAVLSHICDAKAYYIIEVDSSKYQLEIDLNNAEWKGTYLTPEFKAITLMRWIRKGIENEKFIQLI